MKQYLQRIPIYLVVQYVIVTVVVMAVTLILFTLHIHASETKLSLLYLLLVLGCAAVAHPSATLFCGVLSFLCYDFFLVPPYLDLRFDAPFLALDPLAVVCVAIVTGILAGRSRKFANEKAAYKQADELRATLLNLIAHNLRTPLATTKAAITSVLLLPDTNPDAAQLLQYANQECDHLNRLVGNVLSLSRLDAKAIRLNKDWNAIDEVISVVLQRWPQALADHRLSASIPPNLPLVSFDFELIEAVLTNLVDNAFRHGKPPVKIATCIDKNELRTSVEDQGVGVPATEREKLFNQPFRPKAKGIGLGLAVCKGLIAAHQGHLWAEFEPGITRFIFALPLIVYVDVEDTPEHDAIVVS